MCVYVSVCVCVSRGMFVCEDMRVYVFVPV